jgi:hypothetical protein
MRRKIILATVLCLAVAALGIGATPALAAGGCTCHTAVPPTATAAHAPFVIGVSDCTTCHVGWTVPHPAAVTPTLAATVVLVGGIIKSNTVRGGLSTPWTPLRGVVVYVQMLRPDATEYTDIGKCTTNWKGLCFKKAAGDGAVRCISRGVAGPPVILPSLSVSPVDLPTPRISSRLSGPTAGILKLGRRVSVTGRARPLALAGQTIIIRYAGRRAGKTTEHAQIRRTVSATGTYRWTFRPSYRGAYIMRAVVPRTSAYDQAVAPYLRFRVE